MMAPPPATPSRACGPRLMKNGSTAAVPSPTTRRPASPWPARGCRGSGVRKAARHACKAQAQRRDDAEGAGRPGAAAAPRRFQPGSDLRLKASFRARPAPEACLGDAPEQQDAGGQQVDSAGPGHDLDRRCGPEDRHGPEHQGDNGTQQHRFPQVLLRGRCRAAASAGCQWAGHRSSLVGAGTTVEPSTIHRSDRARSPRVTARAAMYPRAKAAHSHPSPGRRRRRSRRPPRAAERTRRG